MPQSQRQGVNDPTSIQRVGIALFALMLAMLVWLFLLSHAAANGESLVVGVRFTGYATIDHGQVLLLAVIAAGALGGCIHVATSFSAYVGNARYRATWEWWYLLRPFIGSALAVAFYFLIRGGMLSLATGGGQDPSFYGMVGIAFMVGMFSKQATDKLDDVFDTLFNTEKDDERRDGLETKPPAPRALKPASVEAGTASQKVVISGLHLAGATVKLNGADHAPDLTAEDRIELTLAAEDLASPKTHEITVQNTVGAAPDALRFTVTERRGAGGGSPDDRGGPSGGAATTIDLTGVSIQPATDSAAQATIDAANAAADSATAPSAESDESDGEADSSASADAVVADAAVAAATSAAAAASTQPQPDDATANAAG